MSKVISKEDLVPMDAPGDGWHHIESNEEHPAQRGGVEIVQVLDNAAMAAIVEAGVPEEGLPVDVEHRGVPGVAEVPDTAAAGWVRELAVFDDGAGNMQLAGRIEWTPPGLELVAGRPTKRLLIPFADSPLRKRDVTLAELKLPPEKVHVITSRNGCPLLLHGKRLKTRTNLTWLGKLVPRAELFSPLALAMTRAA